MAILVVDDITDAHDIAELISYLGRAIAEGDLDGFVGEGTLTLTKRADGTPSAAQVADLVRLGEAEVCEDPSHRDGCSCQAYAAATDPRQQMLVDAERHVGPVPYVLCSQIGQHERLTDCWLCWSDVHRGAIALEDALVGVNT